MNVKKNDSRKKAYKAPKMKVVKLRTRPLLLDYSCTNPDGCEGG